VSAVAQVSNLLYRGFPIRNRLDVRTACLTGSRAIQHFGNLCFGGVFGTIKARSDKAFRKLTARIISFYHDQSFNMSCSRAAVIESCLCTGSVPIPASPAGVNALNARTALPERVIASKLVR